MTRDQGSGIRNQRPVWLFLTLVFLSFSAWAADAGALFSATLNGLDGKAVPLAKWQGKPLVVNFWARWCGPCKKEIPDLLAAQAKHGDVTLIGIAIEDDSAAENIKDFAKAYDMSYPLLLGREKGLALMHALGNETGALPFTVAVGPSGKLLAQKLGALNNFEAEALFSKALQP